MNAPTDRAPAFANANSELIAAPPYAAAASRLPRAVREERSVTSGTSGTLSVNTRGGVHQGTLLPVNVTAWEAVVFYTVVIIVLAILGALAWMVISGRSRGDI